MKRAVIALVTSIAWAWAAPAAAAQHQHPQPPAKPQAPATQKPATEKPAPQKPAEDHSAHTTPPTEQDKNKPKEPIPPITDADRAAAFPQGLEGHAVHDRNINTFVLFDQLEWQGGGTGGFNLENTSWIGGDINRLWIRAEGESEDGDLESAFVHGLWGRSFSRWWDVVAGVRQDFRPGDPQTWAAVGIQGLAPYWFELEGTGYIGAGGRTHARFEAEYDLLLTNRLILQPLLELEMYGKDDPERGIGAGLSSLETGLRLRYEFRREFAPYIGLTWDRKLFGTADFARAEGEEPSNARLAFGLRTWF
jgi:copper resistance protein B